MKATNRILALTLSTAAIFATSTYAQTLPITSGLQLWLKADAGVTTNASGLITVWTDQSGQGNNAAPTNNNTSFSPTLLLNSLNGRPTVRFPGGTKYLDVQDSPTMAGLTNDVTIITVLEQDNLSGFRAGISKTAGNQPAPFDWWNNTGSTGNGRTVLFLNPGNGGGGVGFVGTLTPPVGVYNVVSFTWKDGVLDHFLNDFNTGHFTYSFMPTNAARPLRIGSRADVVTQLIGNMAEILIYQPALSEADRLNVITNYLKPRWGLTFDLPASVSITGPANGSSAAASSTIPVSMTASDPDGTVARIDVYGNGSLIGSTTLAPYVLNVSAAYPGLLTLTAVATDNYGRPSTSAPVAVTISGSAPANPVSSGLQVWLSADAGVTTNPDSSVSTWADQTSNGNNATPVDPSTSPTLVSGVVNGKPVLRFNGTNQFLQVSDAGTAFVATNFSTFAVVKFNNFLNAPKNMIWTKCSGGFAAPLDWWWQTTALPQVFVSDGTTAGAGPAAGTQAYTAGQFSIAGLTATLTTTNAAVTNYFANRAVGGGTLTTNIANVGAPLQIGQRPDQGAQMNGDLAELVIYNQVLSDTDRSNVVSYLSTKYNFVQPSYASPSPSVAIINPTNSQTFAAPATSVPFTVTASSTLGVITRVQLFANSQLFATLTNAPYQIRLDLLTPGTVTYSAVAQDNWGIQSTSAPVVVTVTGAAAAPPVTNGLQLWLAADAGVTTNDLGAVTNWVDQSLHGNDAAATNDVTAPQLVSNVLNGKPVLRFSGANQSLEVPAPGTAFTAGDISTFAMVKFSNFSTFRSIWEKTLGNRPAPVDWYFASGSGNATVYRGDGTIIGNVVGGAAPAGAFVIVGFKTTGQAVSQYLGYNLNGSGSITAAPVDQGLPLRIGRRFDGGVQMSGDIAEILIYDHAVSDSERLQIANYLFNKWGLTVVQLANVPPTVTITTPTNGAAINAAGLLSVVAQVTDPDSPISRVDFLVNGTVINSRTAPPYQIPLQVLTPGSLTLQVRATDIWGAVSNSLPVTVTVTGNSPSAPPTSGLALWLKSDAGVTTNVDGTISGWADQSGNTNDAVQLDSSVAPSLVFDDIIGKSVLAFDGALRFMDVATAPTIEITGDMSLFYTANFTNFNALRTICAKTFNNLPRPFDYQVNGAAATLLRGNDDGNTAVASSGPLPGAQYIVGGVTVLGSFVSHYLNGLPNGSGSLVRGDLDLGTPLRIGSRDDFATQFAGNLGEILLYNVPLVGNDLELVNTYLAGRYGIPVVQLATQPSLTVNRTNSTSVQISWPPGFAGFVLESRTNVAGGAWISIVTNPPNNQVSLATTNITRFFRLRAQ